MINTKNALILSPHPDDAEYAMLSTILRHINCRFHIYNLSCGSPKDKTTSEKRFDECKNLYDKLSKDGYNHIKYSNVPVHDIEKFTEGEWINHIEKNLCLSDIDTIFIPPKNDLHYEHRIVNSIGKALTRLHPISIIEYKTVSVDSNWIPNLSIDIGSSIFQKIEYLRYFKSQQHRSYFSLDSIKSFHIDFSCNKRNIQYVEQFRIISAYAK